MRLLALDSATDACSAAVGDGDQLWSRFALAPRQHNRLLPRMIDEVLQESGIQRRDLQGVVCGIGPGSFTGIRIAVGLAQGLAHALGLAVYPVSSTLALAKSAFDQNPDLQRIAVALDARMAEIYWSVYRRSEGGSPAIEQSDQLAAPQSVEMSEGGSWVAAGNAWHSYADSLTERLAPERVIEAWPRADAMLRLAWQGGGGEAVAAHDLVPLYLRSEVAQKRATRR